MKGAWSFLKHPSKKDVTPRRRRKAFDALPGEFEHLFIMDLEWTCDNIRSSFPLEIIEFSGVLMKQTPRKPGLKVICALTFPLKRQQARSISIKSLCPTAIYITQVVSEFSRYIKPKQNQALSNFCIELTGISQDQVDSGIRLDACFAQFEAWLAL